MDKAAVATDKAAVATDTAAVATDTQFPRPRDLLEPIKMHQNVNNYCHVHGKGRLGSEQGFLVL